MPSGRTHDTLALISVPIAFGAGVSWGGLSWWAAGWLALGCFIGGFYFSPDLDTHSRPYRRWGPIRWLWLPYQKLMPHRSAWSHGVIVGPMLQCLYLAGMLALVWLLLHSLAYLGSVWLPANSLQHLGRSLINEPWKTSLMMGRQIGLSFQYAWGALISLLSPGHALQITLQRYQGELLLLSMGLLIGGGLHTMTDLAGSAVSQGAGRGGRVAAAKRAGKRKKRAG